MAGKVHRPLATAVAGIGQSEFFRRGEADAPEFVLVLRAILAACDDAKIDPKSIDGFSSFGPDHNASTRIAAALGIRELRLSVQTWGGGGGGSAAALANAAAAIATGQAERVVVFRGLAMGGTGRFGQAAGPYANNAVAVGAAQGWGYYGAWNLPYGLMTSAQILALRTNRVFQQHKRGWAAQKAVAMASYFHAQNNVNAVMYGRPLSADMYDSARMISEPFRLYDCCQESDGAAALILVGRPNADEHPSKPVFLLGATQGSGPRGTASAENEIDYPQTGQALLAKRLWESTGYKPSDVDVAQIYENFTGASVLSLIDHGFCTIEDADEVLSFENLTAPAGKLPLNTSGGNLAEAYIHGMALHLEAVRQLRGVSSNQVPNAQLALSAGGPLVEYASTSLFGTAETL